MENANPNFTFFKYYVDIEVYDDYGDGHWAQAHYLAHSLDDSLRTDNLDYAIEFIKNSLLLEEDVRKTN